MSSSEKKVGKTSYKLFFEPNLHKKGIIKGHAQNKKNIFFWQKWQKQIIIFQKLFTLSKYNMFWLSYESFIYLGWLFL